MCLDRQWRQAKKEAKYYSKIAQAWKYRATVEEIEDKDAQVHIRGGVTEGDMLMEENDALPDMMEEHYI